MRYLLLTSSFIFLTLLSNCNDCDDCKGDGIRVMGKFYYINQSSETVIFSDCNFADFIAPLDTLVLETFENQPTDVTTNTFGAAIQSPCTAIYATSLTCEKSVYFIDQYEIRTKIDDKNYEFTFYFTDEKLALAEKCP